jgi:hypothetical protein
VTSRRQAVVAAIATLLLLGCDGTDEPPPPKATQCEALMSTIAQHEQGMQSGDEPNALLATANAIEKAGAAAQEVTLYDDALIAARDRYVKMARDLGFVAREAGLTFAKDDEEARVRVAARLHTSRAVERKVRAALAEQCGSGAAPTPSSS